MALPYSDWWETETQYHKFGICWKLETPTIKKFYLQKVVKLRATFFKAAHHHECLQTYLGNSWEQGTGLSSPAYKATNSLHTFPAGWDVGKGIHVQGFHSCKWCDTNLFCRCHLISQVSVFWDEALASVTAAGTGAHPQAECAQLLRLCSSPGMTSCMIQNTEQLPKQQAQF